VSDEQRLYTLIAELTYRCPLRCPYCSNPLDFQAQRQELSSAEWLRVIAEAESLGALQLNLTGGEPLLRDDLELLVAEAKRLELFVNLITSGLPLARERLVALRDAGLNGVQVSIQDAERGPSERIAGTASFEQKRSVARWVKELGLPLTLNVVLHRENLARIPAIVAMAEELGADRLELANTQYLGWALLNREALLPTPAQLATARALASAAKERLKGRMEVLFVLPDYYSDRPKACMNGWGSRYMVVAPDGRALPCHLAHSIPGLAFDNVRERALADIWQNSAAFMAFRGEAWMSPTCSSCERRKIDFGGCRCQAFHLTGDARATDPVCSLSPDHGLVLAARARAQVEPQQPLLPLRYRGARKAVVGS
jgi:pyrroloquinoline quinone biosynthesis protein E